MHQMSIQLQLNVSLTLVKIYTRLSRHDADKPVFRKADLPGVHPRGCILLLGIELGVHVQEDFVQQGDGKRCSESPPRFAFQSPPPQAPLIPQNPVLPNGLPSGYSTGASGASATNIIALVQGR